MFNSMSLAEFVAYPFHFNSRYHFPLFSSAGLLDHPREARDVTNFLRSFAFPNLAAAVNADGLLCATCHGSKVAGKRDVEGRQAGPCGVNEVTVSKANLWTSEAHLGHWTGGKVFKINIINDSSTPKVNCSTEREDM